MLTVDKRGVLKRYVLLVVFNRFNDTLRFHAAPVPSGAFDSVAKRNSLIAVLSQIGTGQCRVAGTVFFELAGKYDHFIDHQFPEFKIVVLGD